MWLKRICLKFFVRSSDWQKFEFCKHFGGKIGNCDNFLPILGLRAGLVFALPILPPKCLQNTKFCQSDDLTKNFKTFSFQPFGFRASFCALRRKSCELSHVIYLKLTILIIVSSFPKLNDG